MTTKPSLSPRKKSLLVTGKRFILSKGYTATTVDEIVEEVGVTKGAFYYFFKSKEAFAQELLEYIWSPVREMQTSLVDQDVDPLQLLHEHVDFMVAFLPGDGRLMGILSQELSETNPQIGEQVGTYFRNWTQFLEQLVEVTKERYTPDAEFTSQGVMEFIILTIEGVPIVSRQLGKEAVARSVVHLKHYINSLFLSTK